MYRYFLLLIFLASVAAWSKEPWRPGHIYCPDASKATPDGTTPLGARLILEDGTSVDVSVLTPDDAFQQLVDRWVKVRHGYYSDPSLVSAYVYKLDSLALGKDIRSVEIRYVSNGITGKQWKGITHIIKAR